MGGPMKRAWGSRENAVHRRSDRKAIGARTLQAARDRSLPSHALLTGLTQIDTGAASGAAV